MSGSLEVGVLRQFGGGCYAAAKLWNSLPVHLRN